MQAKHRKNDAVIVYFTFPIEEKSSEIMVRTAYKEHVIENEYQSMYCKYVMNHLSDRWFLTDLHFTVHYQITDSI